VDDRPVAGPVHHRRGHRLAHHHQQLGRIADCESRSVGNRPQPGRRRVEPEYRGVFSVWLLGTLFGAVFISLLAGVLGSMSFFDPRALALGLASVPPR
jgi:hypothetical protein